MSLIKGWHAVLLQRFELSLRHPSPSGTSGPRSTSPQQAWPSWHRQSLQFQLAAQPCKLFLFNRHFIDLPCYPLDSLTRLLEMTHFENYSF